MSGRGLLPLSLAASLVACAPSSPPVSPGPADGFAFGVVGDTPYSDAAERLFPALADEISSADLAFVIHVGDLKSGMTPCTDSLLASRIEALGRLGHPVVYLPGDNEWTDCHRGPDGIDAPLERLALLRTLAYPEPERSLGSDPIRVERQRSGTPAGFPEHQRWARDGVLFATLHAVGSLNGLAPFDGRSAEDDAELDRRIEASVAWLRETFAQARARRNVAVVVAMHSDPWAIPPGFEGRTGYEELLTALREETEAYGRPVLLVHGDTHALRLDRPLLGASGWPVHNLTRLETFGDPDVGWVRVRVDPASRDVFTFSPHRVVPGGTRDAPDP